ncbi:uncharacterized protein LOC143918910 isoform X2 [Arctopsyche grandis]|uniref:uncharacterized protein LOC143918910 isoform X2 n=1 Tax=Arctopsyche grandis TaxID=121162 RepID=UPI00406D82DC
MRVKNTNSDRTNGAQVRSGTAPCRQRPSSPPVATTLSTTPALERSVNNNHQDADFTHDNSDYQWFLDYNYRDSSCQHASVLSSLSSSYKGLGSLACYEELARDLDANLAEADMESFRTRDIHALLSNLPPSACHLMQDTNRRGEMYASITSSLMEKFCFDSSFSPHSSSQGEDSTAGSINTMSICKSELLFSPVKETSTVPGHFSVDSLDCDRLEQDLILTCQANKHNYTIAFEGSITMYSEDSDCQDVSNEKQDLPGEAKYSSSSETHNSNTYSTEKLRKSFRLQRPIESSLAQSDSGLITWSKMKNRPGQSQLKRQPSGNNNEYSGSELSRGMPTLKSQSAPDLRSKHHCQSVTSSPSAHVMSSNTESCSTDNHLNLPSGCLKTSGGSQNSHTPELINSSENPHGRNSARPPNFNLVKLFMKQKSMSNDRIMNSLMDHSEECWPNSSEAGDSGDSFSTDSKTKASGYSAKIGRDKNYQNDDCDIKQSESKNNTKKWVDSATNEYSTCTFEDSLVEGTNISETITKRAHDFIMEEDEISENSERNLYATVNKPLNRPSINNFENLGVTGSPVKVRGNTTTQTRKSTCSSITSASISSCSESEGTQITRLHKLFSKDNTDHKATSTQVPHDLMDKSMQTSFLSNLHAPRERSVLKVVEPSFLEKLKKGDSQKPVYVLYPNYTLPDLGFISKDQNIDKVIFKPLKFAPSPDEPAKTKDKRQGGKNARPFSCNDVEGLRKKGFNHIRDWDSLTFLLPMEYRQILAEMPEIVQQLKDKEEELLRHKERPLFCVSPPVKHKARPVSCDCASLLSNNTTNVSSSSSTATQPSSGYRGSSTMLTDSSAQNSPAPAPGFNPLFVYKYDSATSSEASFMNEKQRSGIPGSGPPLPKRSISLAEQSKMAINGKVIDIAPPRPPLPKGILRKSVDKTRKNTPNTKRYSMFEMEDPAQDAAICMNMQTEQKVLKRRSLQEPYYLLKNNSIVEMKKNNDLAAKRFSQQFLDAAEKDIDDTEFFHDEGVGTESSLESGKSHDINGARPSTPPLPRPVKGQITEVNPCVFPTSLSQPILTSCDLQQLEDFLKHSGITCNDMEQWDNTQIQKVKNQVTKFLCMKRSDDDKESLDSSCSSGHSKKSVSFAEKGESKRSADELRAAVLKTPPNSPNISSAAPHRHYQIKNLAEIPICEEGESSPEGYASPTNSHGLHRQSSTEIAQKRGLLSDVLEAVDTVAEEGTGAPRLIVGLLCPALYGLFSDGLRDSIDTPFGPANNSVWQVIEASARQGPITKSLNELVMRINSEDALSESVLKFNAFIMGLLNVRSLDAFVSYLRTRESVLRRHYTTNALLRGGSGLLSGGSGGTLIAALAPLANMPFNLDLLWQLKDMHRSFKRMEDMMSNESNSSGEWGVERVGGKFRRLQRRWEMLSGQETSPSKSARPNSTMNSTASGGSTPGSAGSTPGSTSGKSKIPRPVTSPVRPHAQTPPANTVSPVKRGIPVAMSQAKKVTTPPSNQRSPLPPLPHSTVATARVNSNLGGAVKKTINTNRISRPEVCGNGPAAPRPSSLPYRRATPPSTTRPRRAASTSQTRPTAPANNHPSTKMVRTLWHRLPSDSGHLAFNEGERLRLVLEVDDQWLLCCRGQQKGLVPRNAVLPVPDSVLQKF